MKTSSDESLISQFPKIELHAHLNGCIRSETLEELAKQRKVELSHHFTSDHLAASSSNNSTNGSLFFNRKPRSLQDCFDIFAEIPKCVNDLVALEQITREALEDFASDNVAYLELRSTPKRLLKSHLESEALLHKMDYVQCVLSVMKQFEQEEIERYTREHPVDQYSRLPMKCRLIISVDRSQSLEEAEENIDLASNLVDHGEYMIVGCDLGGNPTRNDFRLFRHLFERARSIGLKITLHCAEVDCGNDRENEGTKIRRAKEEAKAMLDFFPDRLGHALLLPSSLEKKLLELKIPVETCPTSNVMTLELEKRAEGDLLHGLRQHPALKQWLDLNHPISICTDDSGVFDTCLSKELILVHHAFGIELEALGSIILASIEHAFCGEDLKSDLNQCISARIEYIMKEKASYV